MTGDAGDELGQQKTRQDMCMGVEARRRRRPTRGRGSGGCGGGWSSGSGSFIGLRVRGRHSPFGFYGTIGFFSFSGDEVVVFLRAPAPILLGSSPYFCLRCVSKSSTRDVPFSCSRPRFCSHRPHNSASPASKNAPLLSRQHCNLNSHQVLFALWGGRITPPHRALDRAREERGPPTFPLGKLWKRKSPQDTVLSRQRGAPVDE